MDMSNFYTLEDRQIRKGFISRYLKSRFKAFNHAVIQPVKTFAIDYSFPEIIALLLVTAFIIGLGAVMAHVFLTV